ncbi:MAG: hypothetical protein ACRDLF_03935 [Solirubrobacteraceae bacterium]
MKVIFYRAEHSLSQTALAKRLPMSADLPTIGTAMSPPGNCYVSARVPEIRPSHVRSLRVLCYWCYRGLAYSDGLVDGARGAHVVGP